MLEDGIETESLKSKEKEYIVKHETLDCKNGYNIQQDPRGGDTLTGHPNYGEIIEEMRKKNSGKENGFYGREHSKESLKLLKQKFKGKNNPMPNKKHDAKTRKKMSEAAEGRYTLEWFIERYGEEEGREKYEERNEEIRKRMEEDNPMDKEEYRKKVAEGLRGKEKSEEHKQNIAEARKGKATGKDNPNYVSVPKDELEKKISEGLVSGELAEHFDTSKNTITRKVKKYWDKGLRQVRKEVS